MSQNNNDQEIDLGQLFQKFKEVGNFFIDKIFDFILFIKNNIIILTALIIVGFITGLYLSKATQSYDQKIIVSPNFGSIDYLKDKIELFNSKITNKDSVFFKSIKIDNYKNIGEITLEPIVDIYSFVSIKNNPSSTDNPLNTNLDLFRLLSDNDKISTVLEDEITSKNFKKQLIHFNTKKAISSSEVIVPILTYLNDSKYYNEIKDLSTDIYLNKIKANDSIIFQIDKILNQFSKSQPNSDKLIYFSDSNQLSDLIKEKNSLLEEQAELKLSLINENETIKEVSSTLNSLETHKKDIDYKLILPLIFVFLFIFTKGFIRFYKSQMLKRNAV